MSKSSKEIIEIIKDKLYIIFIDNKNDLSTNILSNYAVFNNDSKLIYTSFFADFGPLNLGLSYLFCTQLSKVTEANKKVLYCISNQPHHRTNSAVLLCSYLIFVLNYSAERAYTPFIGIDPSFIPYRDAGFCINTFPITVIDCCRAMRKAKTLGHFNYRSFNLSQYESLNKLQNGDITWIIPNKFIAFSGPVNKRRQISPGVFSLSPDGYVPIFKRLGVTCVVRFNSKCYDRNVFLMNGIRHVDLFYEDGGNPTEAILQAFLKVCETETGAIAVHCKAGLGRTGTNIAAFMMKHYQYTARECIAWCRICRPGSIVGPQQQYLASIEERMFKEGEVFRAEQSNPHQQSYQNNNITYYHDSQPLKTPILTTNNYTNTDNDNRLFKNVSSVSSLNDKNIKGKQSTDSLRAQLRSQGSITDSRKNSNDIVELQRPKSSGGKIYSNNNSNLLHGQTNFNTNKPIRGSPDRSGSTSYNNAVPPSSGSAYRSSSAMRRHQTNDHQANNRLFSNNADQKTWKNATNNSELMVVHSYGSSDSRNSRVHASHSNVRSNSTGRMRPRTSTTGYAQRNDASNNNTHFLPVNSPSHHPQGYVAANNNMKNSKDSPYLNAFNLNHRNDTNRMRNGSGKSSGSGKSNKNLYRNS